MPLTGRGRGSLGGEETRSLMKRHRWVALVGVVAAAGCALESAPPQQTRGGEQVGERRASIVEGQPSGDDQNQVVLLRLTALGPASVCSGVLVAPNLVLTALHCLATYGTPASGMVGLAECIPGVTSMPATAAFNPDSVNVFVSSTRAAPKATPQAVGAKLMFLPSFDICDGDVAAVLLDRDIPDAPIAPIRFERDVELGEKVTAVGWGMAADDGYPKQRQQRELTVSMVGPGTYVHPLLGGSIEIPGIEFVTSSGPCSADSGSPTFDASGAVVGIFSSVFAPTVTGGGLTTEACSQAVGIYEHVPRFSAAVQGWFKQAKHAPWVAGKARPGPFGAPCDEDAVCDSLVCAAGACSVTCDDGTCPPTLTCVELQGRKACVTPGAVGAAGAGGEAGSAGAAGGAGASVGGKLGDTCSTASDCASGLCLRSTTPVCSESCANTACPGGWACVALDGQQVCVQDAVGGGGDDASCALRVGGDAGESKWGALGLLAVVGGLAARRRVRGRRETPAG